MTWEDAFDQWVADYEAGGARLDPVVRQAVYENFRGTAEQLAKEAAAGDTSDQQYYNYDADPNAGNAPAIAPAPEPIVPLTVWNAVPLMQPVLPARSLAPQILPLDRIQTPSEETHMPAAGTAPTISALRLPPRVFEGQPFSVYARADDPDGDLAFLTIRWEGFGPETWDISDVPYNSIERRRDLVAPDGAGTLRFRAEATDKAGHGFVGEWQTMEVIAQAAPATDEISQWVKITRVPTSTEGVFTNMAEALPGAPERIQVAVDDANWAAVNLGAASPQQLQDRIRRSYLDQALADYHAGETIAAVAASTTPPAQTIVAYNGTNPVYQGTAANGTVVQWTETPAGKTTPVAVDVPGIYQAPAVVQVPHEVAAAINAANAAGLPPLTEHPLPVGTNVPVSVNTNVSPLFDPVHRLSGWDANGNEVYHLTDEAGSVVEWAVISGHDSREIIPGTFHHVGDGPSLIVSHTPPAGADHPAGTDNIVVDTAPPAGGSGLLLLALAIGGGLWLKNRRSN